MAELGTRMLVVAMTLKGDTTLGKGQALLDFLCETIGVKKVHAPVILSYPTDGGLGGTGFTCIQPISDSFFAWDSWSDLAGGYLILASCRLFWVREVMQAIRDFGFEILETHINELSLIRDELSTG